MAEFAPLTYRDGYLPIEDHGLIGDGTTAALVGRDGAVVWLCLPRFDSPPLFCRLLDSKRGGAFTLAPEGLRESRQFYRPATGVLVTDLRGESGLVRVSDALALRSGSLLSEDVAAGRRELVRCVEVLDGPVRLKVEIDPFAGGSLERMAGCYGLRSTNYPEMNLQLVSSHPLDGLHSTVELAQGEKFHLALNWGRPLRRHHPFTPDQVLEETADCWHRWMTQFVYDGPQDALVRRSAITLKMLDYLENGAIVAAPTTSLPEVIGGERNWDYRFSWVRDAAFAVYALNRIGMKQEALAFVGWVLDAAERHGQPRVLYDLDGDTPPAECEDTELEGYRGSRPVRWGNGAVEQNQHDIYGEILDCAYLWAKDIGSVDDVLWERLLPFIATASRDWNKPDQGIWEVRSTGRVFTYSAALCQVALDRGANLATRYGLPGDIAAWRACAEQIRQTIIEESWDDKLGSLTEHIGGGGGLDASLLTLPLRRVIPADHPRMIATTAAIAERLSAGDGLLYRYILNESPDGLTGHEGAFLMCSFWLVDNLAMQGRLNEAMDLYNSLCARAGSLGLLPEQIDPSTGAFLGNYPQAFSHVGLISSGVNLSRLLKQRG